MKRIDRDFRRVFIRDTGIQMPVIDSPYFEYFLEMSPGGKESWAKIKDISPGKWMGERRRVKDKVVSDILGSRGYQGFIDSPDITSNIQNTPPETKRDLYNGGNSGKTFLSIDIREANFQTLKWAGLDIFSGKETWKDFLAGYTDSEIFQSSKHLRQSILGKVAPSRTQGVTRYLTWKMLGRISHLIPYPLYSQATDEIIYILPDISPTIDGGALVREVKSKLGLDVRVSVFTIEVIQRFTRSGASILGYIKNHISRPSELKGVPGLYYPQFWKAWKEVDLNPVYDLVFEYQGETARFDYPLSIVNPNGEE